MLPQIFGCWEAWGLVLGSIDNEVAEALGSRVGDCDRFEVEERGKAGAMLLVESPNLGPRQVVGVVLEVKEDGLLVIIQGWDIGWGRGPNGWARALGSDIAMGLKEEGPDGGLDVSSSEEAPAKEPRESQVVRVGAVLLVVASKEAVDHPLHHARGMGC